MTEEIMKRLEGVEHQLKFFREAYIQMHNEIVKGTHIRINETPFRNAFADLKQIIQEIKETSKELRNESIIGTMKFMAKQIHEMKQAVDEIKEKGLKKQIHLDFTLDGYEMVRKQIKMPDTNDEKNIINPDEDMRKLLLTLSARESEVLIHRFGLLGNKSKTLDAIGKIFAVTRERIRSIESMALRKCRHPSKRQLVEHLTHKELRKAILGE